MAVGKLPVRSCLIDGEAIVCDQNGLAVFDLIRGPRRQSLGRTFGFDLLELDGRDLRRQRSKSEKLRSPSYSSARI